MDVSECLRKQDGNRLLRSGGDEQQGERPPAPAPETAMDRHLPRPPRWRRYGPYALAAVLATGALLWLLRDAGISTYRVPTDQLTIGTVTRGRFEDYIAVRGTVAPLTTWYLTTEQGGVVKQVLADDGAAVKTGQPLVVLSNAPLRLEVASRQADAASQINAIETTRLQLEQTRFQYERELLDIQHHIGVLQGDLVRDKILFDGHAIAPSVYSQEKLQYRYELKLRAATLASSRSEQQVRATQLAQLRTTLAWLNDNIKTARSSLAALTIRAPSNGQLTALDAHVGESKPAGAVLGQVDSLDRFKLTADIDEFYIGRIALGQTALFTLGGHRYRARIVKIHPQVSNGTFRVDLHFEGPPPRGITVGQAIDMRLELGEATEALMLPNGPFYQDTGGRWAFVLTPDGHYATRRNIELGRRNPDHLEILQGLESGERVIISRYKGFRHVSRVELERPAHGD